MTGKNKRPELCVIVLKQCKKVHLLTCLQLAESIVLVAYVANNRKVHVQGKQSIKNVTKHALVCNFAKNEVSFASRSHVYKHIDKVFIFGQLGLQQRNMQRTSFCLLTTPLLMLWDCLVLFAVNYAIEMRLALTNNYYCCIISFRATKQTSKQGIRCNKKINKKLLSIQCRSKR